MYDSAASCKASKAEGWNLKPGAKYWDISRTRRWKANFPISKSVLLWYLRISLRASVPGRYLRIFFIGRVVIGRAVILIGEIGSVDASWVLAPLCLDSKKDLTAKRWFRPILCLSVVCLIRTISVQGSSSQPLCWKYKKVLRRATTPVWFSAQRKWH